MGWWAPLSPQEIYKIFLPHAPDGLQTRRRSGPINPSSLSLSAALPLCASNQLCLSSFTSSLGASRLQRPSHHRHRRPLADIYWQRVGGLSRADRAALGPLPNPPLGAPLWVPAHRHNSSVSLPLPCLTEGSFVHHPPRSSPPARFPDRPLPARAPTITLVHLNCSSQKLLFSGLRTYQALRHTPTRAYFPPQLLKSPVQSLINLRATTGGRTMGRLLESQSRLQFQP